MNEGVLDQVVEDAAQAIGVPHHPTVSGTPADQGTLGCSAVLPHLQTALHDLADVDLQSPSRRPAAVRGRIEQVEGCQRPLQRSFDLGACAGPRSGEECLLERAPQLVESPIHLPFELPETVAATEGHHGSQNRD
jgi:hypothetical protein